MVNRVMLMFQVPKCRCPFPSYVNCLAKSLPRTFYTNHACPWAHRAAITLKELDLPYEEVIIPLDRPRDEWYLKINPRGLVPAIKIDNGILEGEIVTESATVSTFLADAFPKSSFYPASHESPKSALERARMGFFVDTFANKVNSFTYKLIQAEGDEKEELAEKWVAAIENEIEPLLNDKGPFFGGSETMTLADVSRICSSTPSKKLVC